MKSTTNLDFNEILGKKTIIYGEINTGKTKITAEFVRFLLEEKKINPAEISILDFGPKLIEINGKKIGGRISDFYPQSEICDNIKPKGDIIPPRLNAKSKEELHKNAQHNYLITLKSLEEFHSNPTPVLIINDISIYLHKGNEILLLDVIEQCETFLGNTDYGTLIKSQFDPAFSEKEKRLVEKILKKIKFSYFTNKSSSNSS